MKILFTAFNGKNNSSKLLLDTIKVENKLYLKNSFTTSIKQLQRELKNNEYDLIISFGQAPLDMNTIKIETTAKIDIEYKTKYNYTPLKNKLDKNFKTIISNNAGSYLCNHIYYNGLKYIEEYNLITNMIFIHIPMIDNISSMESLSDVFNINYAEPLT